MNAQQQEVARKIAANEYRYRERLRDVIRLRDEYKAATGAERVRALDAWERVDREPTSWYYETRHRLLDEWERVRDPNGTLERETTGTP